MPALFEVQSAFLWIMYMCNYVICRYFVIDFAEMLKLYICNI